MTASRPSHPFDAAAGEYDRSFTDQVPGRWFREIVWHRVRTAFRSGDRILDLGCGTGEDAIWLAEQGIEVTAVDISREMLEAARRKAEAAGLLHRISFLRGDLATLEVPAQPPYDGVLSNFGPLNCVERLHPFAERLAACLRPGASAVFVVMGPVCPWEILWYLLHGRIKTAFRRFGGGVEAHVGGGETLKVWYPSPRRFRHQLHPYFRKRELVGLGTLVPPPYLRGFVERARGIFGKLASVERRWGGTFPFTWLNDHYLMVMNRT